MKFKKVLMIGLGYIGLPTAAVMAKAGINVVGYDINKAAVDLINQGIPHIHEPELEAILSEVIANGRFHATTDPVNADVYMIAVPTPFKESYKPDISFVLSACKSIAPFLVPGNIVILESTSPVGTTELVAECIAQIRPDLSVPLFSAQKDDADIYIAYCPERVLPGKAVYELVNNDRVIGGINHASTGLAVEFYEGFVKGRCVPTNSRAAEMCKLAENSYRDVNIAFANELSMICDSLDINIWELIKLANLHPRVEILQPGPGVGGHCIAVDPWFIVDKSPDIAKLIRGAREVNARKERWVIEKIQSIIHDADVKEIIFLGLSFKKNIDDLRGSPAVEIVQEIANLTQDSEIKLKIIEPFIQKLPPNLLGKKNVSLDLDHIVIEKADLVVLLVDHDIFRSYQKLVDKNKLIDTRGLFAS